MNKIEDKNERALLIHSAKNFYKLYGDIFRELASRFIPETDAKLDLKKAAA